MREETISVLKLFILILKKLSEQFLEVHFLVSGVKIVYCVCLSMCVYVCVCVYVSVCSLYVYVYYRLRN